MEGARAVPENAAEIEELLERISRPISDSGDYDRFLADSANLLTRADFASRSPGWQVEAIWAVFLGVVSSSHALAGCVAALAAPHFRRLLRDTRLDVRQACRMHDALWGMWWCAASSLDDMRPIYSQVCLPFHDFLERHGLVAERSHRPSCGAKPLRVAYLMHYAHAERGNAVAPLIHSLSRAHARLPNRKVFVYAVQWVDDTWFPASFADCPITARSFKQNADYARLDELFEKLQADEVDAVITDVTSSIASVLFARRVAPVQVRLDLGLPYWFQPEIDLVLLSGKRWRDCYPFERDRAAEIRLNQERGSMFHIPDESKIKEARATRPSAATVIGVFTRLIKITPPYLNIIRRVLLKLPQTHLLVGGTGDPRPMQEFMAAPELAGRITFLHRNVDLAVYAHAIDIFVDTFPMIGGLACREIAAQGVPVLSLRSNEWTLKQDQDRDPLSIAENEPALLQLIERAVVDLEFRHLCAVAAVSATTAISDVAISAREVDSKIVAVLERVAAEQVE